MVVTNKTEIDKEEAYNTLLKSAKKSFNSRYITSVFLIIAGVILIVYGHTSNSSMYLTFGYAFVAIGIAYIIMTIIGLYKTPKNIEEANKEICENGVTYNYTFREQSFDVKATTLNKNSKATYKYSQIKKVIDHPDRYELILNENLLFYVLKSGFENEKMIEFFLKDLNINKVKLKPSKETIVNEK